MRPLRTTALISVVFGVAGCALPPAVTIASLVADSISVSSSGKTTTDQAISLFAHKDCRLWRLVQGKPICGSEASVIAVAALPPPLPLRAASPTLRPSEPDVGAPAAAAETPAAATAPAPSRPSLTKDPATRTPSETSSPSAPAVAESAGDIVRQQIAAAPATASRHAAPPAPSAATDPPPMRPATAEARVRGEMIIRSGTDESEARALADALHAAGAVVRPVRHDGVTLYEVVMGLSG